VFPIHFIIPPFELDPGSLEYKTALVAKLDPSSTSLKPFNLSITFFSTSETLGVITI
jgi:hypothetical protein